MEPFLIAAIPFFAIAGVLAARAIVTERKRSRLQREAFKVRQGSLAAELPPHLESLRPIPIKDLPQSPPVYTK